ncbi:MAG: NUDIX domain-containing protein [Fibrobacter sp.]|jgi:isopentenyl-diphosphate delta-isomerase|nr:NUDIX domain-containing protein [Fibrobacter sp.]
MEFLDVLNPDGSPAGERLSREEVHRKGLHHRTVHVWVRNAKGELLLQKRSSTKEIFPGLWDISCAGHLSASDSSLDGAVRELEEELGISVNKDELQFLFTIPRHYTSTVSNIIENEITDVYLLKRRIEPGNLEINRSEIDEVQFIPTNELKKRVEKRDPDLADHEVEYMMLLQGDWLQTSDVDPAN